MVSQLLPVQQIRSFAFDQKGLTLLLVPGKEMNSNEMMSSEMRTQKHARE
jgi:hypothetical protein